MKHAANTWGPRGRGHIRVHDRHGPQTSQENAQAPLAFLELSWGWPGRDMEGQGTPLGFQVQARGSVCPSVYSNLGWAEMLSRPSCPHWWLLPVLLLAAGTADVSPPHHGPRPAEEGLGKTPLSE